MVGEFPELQGIMGAYYAEADGEAPDVVRALREQYRNRLDTPVQRDGLTMAVLFIAERAETLVGIWSIGLAPTGERDPYGLRRAALGLISAFEQLAAGSWLKPSENGPLALQGVLRLAADSFGTGQIADSVLAEVGDFIYERYRNQLAADFERNAVDAVIALAPPPAPGCRPRACRHGFRRAAGSRQPGRREQADRQPAEESRGDIGATDAARLQEPAELALAQAIERLSPRAQSQFDAATSPAASARWPRRARRWTRFSPMSWSWPTTRPCAPTAWPCWANSMA